MRVSIQWPGATPYIFRGGFFSEQATCLLLRKPTINAEVAKTSMRLPQGKEIMDKGSGSHLPDLHSFGDILSAVYSTKEWKTPWRLFHLLRDWPVIVGTEVARLTAPAFFRKETLWIYVQDSAWMHHLQYVKPDLLVRINRHLGEQPIADLRWQLQPLPPPRPERPLSLPQKVNPEQEQSFLKMTETIANQECREALQRLWRTFATQEK
jgi:hypothetical protein